MSDNKPDGKKPAPEKKPEPTMAFIHAAEQKKNVVIDRQPVTSEADAIVAIWSAIRSLDQGGAQRVMNYIRERIQSEYLTTDEMNYLMRERK